VQVANTSVIQPVDFVATNVHSPTVATHTGESETPNQYHTFSPSNQFNSLRTPTPEKLYLMIQAKHMPALSTDQVRCK